MKDYKVGDEILVKGRIEKIDAEDYQRTYRIGFSKDGYSSVSYECWPDNDNIVESDKTYEDGLKDAWEMARIYSSMSDSQRHETFDDKAPLCFFENWSAIDAISRYNEVTIKPGDVVYLNAGEQNLRNKFVILAIDEERIHGYSYCDDVYRVQNLTACASGIIKTGEHVDLSFLTNGGVKENG